MTPKKDDRESRQDRYGYATKWVALIGPEYAAIIRLYRKLILVGIVGIFVGLAAGLFWDSRAGNVSQTTGILGAIAFDVPGLSTFTTGMVLQTRLSYKIDRDLRAAQLPTAKYAPDLRNQSRFLFWCRRFGVTPEHVQEAGRRAAESRSAARERSAPNDRGWWDFASKEASDRDRADAD